MPSRSRGSAEADLLDAVHQTLPLRKVLPVPVLPVTTQLRLMPVEGGTGLVALAGLELEAVTQTHSRFVEAAGDPCCDGHRRPVVACGGMHGTLDRRGGWVHGKLVKH